MDLNSQTNRIKEHLLAGNKITALDALHLFGCLRLSGRIHNLRHEHGLNIKSNLIEVNGKRIAEYSIQQN